MKFFKSVFEYNNDKEQKNSFGNEPYEALGELAVSQEIIENSFKGRKLFEIGEMPNDRHPIFVGEHIAGFMHTDNGVMTIGICVKDNDRMPYKINKKIALSYAENEEFFLADAKIAGIREAGEKDLAELDNLFQQRMQSLVSVLGSLKFIVADIIIISQAKKQNRRQHLRIAVNWTVYFKILNPDSGLKKTQQKWLRERKFETTHGYFKTTTADVSAGGYKSIIKAQVPEKTEIDCVIEIKGKDNMKAVGRVRGEVLGCFPNHIKKNYYDMRVKFLDMSESTMSVMSKTIEAHK